MKTTRTPATPCPTCGYKMDAASCPYSGETPSPGDPSVCLKCGELLVFSDEMVPRRPTARELLNFQLNPVWPKIEHTIRAVRTLNPLAFKKKEAS